MRQGVCITSTELQPGHKPTEQASDSGVTQETPMAVSVHLSHWPCIAPMKTAAHLPSMHSPYSQSFYPASPSSFLCFLCDYPHHPTLYFFLWPHSFCPLFHHSTCFLWFTLMTPHFWSPEPFHPFYPQSLPSSYDLSISFCSALYSWIWFNQPPLPSPPLPVLALLSPIPFP